MCNILQINACAVLQRGAVFQRLHKMCENIRSSYLEDAIATNLIDLRWL